MLELTEARMSQPLNRYGCDDSYFWFRFVLFLPVPSVACVGHHTYYMERLSWLNLWWNSVMRANTCTPLCGFSKIMSGSVSFAWELHLAKAFQPRSAFGKHERDDDDQKIRHPRSHICIRPSYTKVEPFFVFLLHRMPDIREVTGTKTKSVVHESI